MSRVLTRFIGSSLLPAAIDAARRWRNLGAYSGTANKSSALTSIKPDFRPLSHSFSLTDCAELSPRLQA